VKSFGFSQNTLEEVFIKVSSDSMDFKRAGETTVPLKPLGARDVNGGLALLSNQLLGVIYCRLVQLAPKRSFMQLFVFFSLSFGLVVLSGCLSLVQLAAPPSEAAYIRQPVLHLTPSAAFKNHLVKFWRAFYLGTDVMLCFSLTCPSQMRPLLPPCSLKAPPISVRYRLPV
jgi:hypothetical protein